MSYVVVEDVAASWEHYRPFADALAGTAPAGLIMHAAGRTDEGIGRDPSRAPAAAEE